MGKITKFFANSALVQGLNKSKDHELFDGVIKPTITLAHMLAAEMLQNLDVKTEDDYIGSANWRNHRFYFPSFTLSIESRDEHWGYNRHENRIRVPAYEKVTSTLLVNKNQLTGEAEFKILLDAYKQFKVLCEKRKAMTAEEKRQEDALKAIEDLFKPKEIPVCEAPKTAKISVPSQPSSVEALLSPVQS